MLSRDCKESCDLFRQGWSSDNCGQTLTWSLFWDETAAARPPLAHSQTGKHVDSGIALEPSAESLFKWAATIAGPPDTPYEGGTFRLDVVVPANYPMAPPAVRFRTPICHPNVHFKTGEVCVDILKTAWSPAWGLHSAMQAIQALMNDPEPDSPLNCDAGNLLRAGDIRGFRSLVRMYTIDFGMRTGSAE